MTTYEQIVEFSNEIARHKADEIEVDISVFNGMVNLTIDKWDMCSHRRIYSTHIVCDDHATACVIQNALVAFIHKRA